MHLVRWAGVAAYIALDIVMNRPVYYLTARFSVVGGSAGWFRARLIDAAFRHWREWWLVGTDYTRHWMGTGVGFSSDSADLTNHYIGLGVNGGVLLTGLFIMILVKAFQAIGRARRAEPSEQTQFVIWATGAALFAHVVTCLSVSYYDQSIFFLYVTLGAVCAVPSRVTAPRAATVRLPELSHARWNPAFQWQRSNLAGNPGLPAHPNPRR
jgi:hypothetical protein